MLKFGSQVLLGAGDGRAGTAMQLVLTWAGLGAHWAQSIEPSGNGRSTQTFAQIPGMFPLTAQNISTQSWLWPYGTHARCGGEKNQARLTPGSLNDPAGAPKHFILLDATSEEFTLNWYS